SLIHTCPSLPIVRNVPLSPPVTYQSGIIINQTKGYVKTHNLRRYHLTAAALIVSALSTHTALSATWVTWETSAGGNGHSYLAVPGFEGLTWNMADQLAQAQG